MVAGIITLGFIYGAYFTETFRGAFMAVPKGQIEAATAFGFTGSQVFRRILFPAMMRFALPGIGNNWQVVLKATALVSLLGLEDVVKATQLAGKSTAAVLVRRGGWHHLSAVHHAVERRAVVAGASLLCWGEKAEL